MGDIAPPSGEEVERQLKANMATRNKKGCPVVNCNNSYYKQEIRRD